MAQVETIRIQAEGFEDGVRINKDEYDPRVHKPWKEAKPPKSESAKPEPVKDTSVK